MTNENIQVIRVEVVNSGAASSYREETSSISPGTLLATGSIKAGRDYTATDYYNTMLFKKRAKSSDLRKDAREEALNKIRFGITKQTPTDRMMGTHSSASIGDRLSFMASGTGMLLRNAEWKTLGKHSMSATTTATAAYSLYSQHKTIGYNLSGASHAAAKQQRTATTATFATGLGLSLATGQYWATALLMAGRAWQLSQTNRQEIFQIKKSQIISNIMQERLIKDTVQRRF